MTESPCYGCPDRAIGCHADCTEYKRYRELVDAKNRERMEHAHLPEKLSARQKRARQAQRYYEKRRVAE